MKKLLQWCKSDDGRVFGSNQLVFWLSFFSSEQTAIKPSLPPAANMPEGINKTKLKSRTIYNIYFVHSKYSILPVNSHTYGNYKFQVEIGAATKIFISKLHVRYKFTVLCGDYLNWLSTGKIWHTFIYSTFEWFFTLYG